MKRLSAIDLDGTLIAIDSLRALFLRHLDTGLVLLALRRLLGLLDRAAFAAGVSRRLERVLADDEQMRRFVSELEADLDPVVLEMARARAAGGAVTVVVSASPEEYVSRLAARLGFLGIGSHWSGGRYVHCHGERKLELLRRRFPPAEYLYDFAISDNRSDAAMLGAFREAIRYTRRA
jgi:phosphoserine phosphatase